MKVGPSMAPSTHSNNKAMFRVADQKSVICFTHDSILKPTVISEVIFMMLLATLGWLMVILSIHVQYYALLLQRYTVLFSHTKKSVTPCVVLIEFFRSVKVVLVVYIKPSLTIQLQLAEILILFHLLSLLRDSNDKVNRYVCHWLCLGYENIRYCSEATKSFLIWKQSLEIMLRAAQGLAYLHELQVIYGDFKS
ncbi:hypothetical protein HID58_024711 [Brassica napus]|uniref:Protein kinase domain-containing protein n=1 Tax=Brassica napus TaxID=3708 RepID=A0ABQ8CJ10_BRANA|nr:hypothetical protein HID58_024711 [Brassica napus]